MSRTKSPGEILDRLLELCTDAIAGYRHAAAAISDPHIRAVLEQNAAEREEIASVLSYELVELGHKPARHGTIAGALHREYLDVTAAVDRGNPGPLLSICARGERETLAQFSAALGKVLPEHVHNVVQSQLGRVLSASASLERARLDLASR